MVRPFQFLVVPLYHHLRLVKVPMVHVARVKSTVDSTIVQFVILRIEVTFLSLVYDFYMKFRLFIEFIIRWRILC